MPWIGFALDERALLVRTGFWTRRTRLVRHPKIQVVHQSESPFDRRWGMASLGVDVAGSLTPTRIPFLPREVAQELGDQLTRRAGRQVFRW